MVEVGERHAQRDAAHAHGGLRCERASRRELNSTDAVASAAVRGHEVEPAVPVDVAGRHVARAGARAGYADGPRRPRPAGTVARSRP